MLLPISSSSLRKSVKVLALGYLFLPALQNVFVNVADCDQIGVLGGILRIVIASSPDADAGNGDSFVRRLALLRPNAAGHPKAEAGYGGCLQELATIAGK